jgi:hypothetical protein
MFAAVIVDVVDDPGVVGFAHAGRRDAETEEARVESRELRLDGRNVPEILIDDFADLRIRDAGGTAANGEDALDVRREQAFPEHALADHPGGTEEEDVHV